jgi:hypothetical protein
VDVCEHPQMSEELVRVYATADSFEGMLTKGHLEAEGITVLMKGEAEGPYAELSYLALILHINREAIHHTAEILLLRDLYRAGPTLRPADGA